MEEGAEHFECKVLEIAVDWLEELHFEKAIFEMDCENVIKSVMDQQVHRFNSSIVERVKSKSHSSSKF